MPELASVLPLSLRNVRLSRAGKCLLDIEKFLFDGTGVSAILGENGAGKSLFLHVLTALIQPDQGEVLWAGRVPQRIDYRRLGLVLQQPVLLRRSALANITYALRQSGCTRAQAHAQGLQALQRAQLAPLAQVSARVLSGGEQQRLAMARALALNPEVLLLDEPCASLDPTSVRRIELMIQQARDEGMRILLVTHDLPQARRLADDVIFMADGKICAQQAVQDFFFKPEGLAAQSFVRTNVI